MAPGTTSHYVRRWLRASPLDGGGGRPLGSDLGLTLAHQGYLENGLYLLGNALNPADFLTSTDELPTLGPVFKLSVRQELGARARRG
jgi:hypothetical protein